MTKPTNHQSTHNWHINGMEKTIVQRRSKLNERQGGGAMKNRILIRLAICIFSIGTAGFVSAVPAAQQSLVDGVFGSPVHHDKTITHQSSTQNKAGNLVKTVNPSNGDSSFSVSKTQLYETTVPEPSTILFFGLGLITLAGLLRRAGNKNHHAKPLSAGIHLANRTKT